MPSVIPGYEYDIFISYRHNDNRSGWVTEFVRNLQEELATTIKEPLSIYFDMNPRDGLLETHNVDKSLDGKLKCLVFIPIVSQTYCDENSYAWKREFCAFNGRANKDQFGRDIKLRNGNVACRILPVKVHDLDADDLKALADVTGGPLRPIEFIYKEPGVNRPLRPNDEALENFNKTKYPNQVNKVANAIKDIVLSLKNFNNPVFYSSTNEAVDTESSHVATGTNENKKSIVVLPFENLSPDKENEYFSDGLTEEIITDLSNIGSLRVISRNSAMMLKGKRKPTKTIAERLSVRYVLEGSVRKAGDNLRITAQLIDAMNDDHLWAEKFSGTMEDVFDIQEKVSRSIVNSLNLTLSSEEDCRIKERPIDNIQAYECYLQARKKTYRFTESSIDHVLKLVSNALSIVGENELLYATMGFTYWQMVNAGMARDGSALEQAESYAEKAFALNRNSSYGHHLLGLIQCKRGEVQQGIRSLMLALSFDPTNPAVMLELCRFYAESGHAAAAEPLAVKLIELDPLTPINRCIPGYLDLLRGRIDTALPHYRTMYEMDPTSPFSRWAYSWVLTRAGKFDEAFQIIGKLAKENAATPLANLALILMRAIGNEEREVDRLVTPEFRAAARVDSQFSRDLAIAYALINRREESLDWLENSVDKGYINYPYFAFHEKFLENIRGDARFDRLMEKVKVRWEQFSSH